MKLGPAITGTALGVAAALALAAGLYGALKITPPPAPPIPPALASSTDPFASAPTDLEEGGRLLAEVHAAVGSTRPAFPMTCSADDDMGGTKACDPAAVLAPLGRAGLTNVESTEDGQIRRDRLIFVGVATGEGYAAMPIVDIARRRTAGGSLTIAAVSVHVAAID